MPASNHYLATLYSKILLESNAAPLSWCLDKITLLHKRGEQSCSLNYWPIVLSSMVGKLFHKVLALRLENVCFSNDIIDPSIQKSFQRGVNGTMEHIFALTSTLEHARSSGLPLTISFLDLKIAFGSISHLLIKDIMSHLSLSYKVTTYISDLHSNLAFF